MALLDQADVALGGYPMAQDTEQTTPNEGELRREVGLIPLLFSSVGAIIGSGWLFGALYATIEAGPAAIFSWLIAGGVILLLALIHAELGGMFPLTGGTALPPVCVRVGCELCRRLDRVGRGRHDRTHRGARSYHLRLGLPSLARFGYGGGLRVIELSRWIHRCVGPHAPVHGR